MSDHQTYYVPHNSKFPVWVAGALLFTLGGIGITLNSIKNGGDSHFIISLAGFIVLSVTLYLWFKKVIEESFDGLPSEQMHRSYVWSMGWFIFSEVMFFAAFFGALFYVRVFAVPWLGGEGDKALTGQYLWPDFSPEWPPLANPNIEKVTGPAESMASPGIGSWLSYLPFWNTVILLTSSVTIHFAHMALKKGERKHLNYWMALTVLLGLVFLVLQAEEYVVAYRDMGLTLDSGIYGSTFFILTGFHGFHVTLGTFMLIVIGVRCYKGHFNLENQFGFEAVSWYWHFVDVVWLGLFCFVYLL